jgi:hypothetical protein
LIGSLSDQPDPQLTQVALAKSSFAAERDRKNDKQQSSRDNADQDHREAAKGRRNLDGSASRFVALRWIRIGHRPSLLGPESSAIDGRGFI